MASLLNICDINTYEGEAAILIENKIIDYKLEECKLYCSISKENSIPTEELLYNLYLDLKNGNSKENIIANFLFTLASIIYQIAKNQKIKQIAFSGVVFQNITLIDMIKVLSRNEYKLYFHKDLPPNDENISFGQIMYYLHCKK